MKKGTVKERNTIARWIRSMRRECRRLSLPMPKMAKDGSLTGCDLVLKRGKTRPMP